MNTNEEKTVGTNLTVVSEYTPYAIELAEYKQRHKNVVYDVTVPKQMKAAKEARAEIRTTRTSLEKERVRIKAPALERCRQIDAEAKRLTEELVALEGPIDAQIKAEEGRVEAERLEKLLAEQKRVDGLNAEIQAFRDAPSHALGKPSMGIQTAYDKIAAAVVEEEHFAEFYQQAIDAKEAARARLADMLTAQRAAEAEALRFAAERAELERMRAENARLQREADERREADARKEREAEAERQRVHQERSDRIFAMRNPMLYNFPTVKALQGLRDEWEGIQVNTDRFGDLVDDALEAREDGIDLINNRITELEAEAVRQVEVDERMRQEREQAAERERQLQAERDAAEQRALAQAMLAEQQRLASLTLRDAAQAVVDHFAGKPSPQVVKDLAAVLAHG